MDQFTTCDPKWPLKFWAFLNSWCMQIVSRPQFKMVSAVGLKNYSWCWSVFHCHGSIIESMVVINSLVKHWSLNCTFDGVDQSHLIYHHTMCVFSLFAWFAICGEGLNLEPKCACIMENILLRSHSPPTCYATEISDTQCPDPVIILLLPTKWRPWYNRTIRQCKP